MGDWCAVMTTAPRHQSTIEECYNSVIKTGWNPIIFAEPRSIIPTNSIHFINDKKLGPWFNWLNSVRYAVNTGAKFIITLQDDILIHPESKDLIDWFGFPKSSGFISLYTAKPYTIKRNGEINPIGINQLSPGSLLGALALCWKRETLQDLLELPLIKKWKGAGRRIHKRHAYRTQEEPSTNIANIDTAIGYAIEKLEKTMWFVDPSAVEHIGDTSTITQQPNSGRRNAIRIADRSMSLREQVCPKLPK